MDKDFAYVRLVTKVGCIYVCFGKPPADLLGDMIRSLNIAIRWPIRREDVHFELNGEAEATLIRQNNPMVGPLQWSIGGEPTVYGAPLRLVYPEVLEPAKGKTDIARMTRDVAREF